VALSPCGAFNFTCAAKYALHILIASSRPAMSIEQRAQLQQIIYAERRATR
jgi:hypothetical protein